MLISEFCWFAFLLEVDIANTSASDITVDVKINKNCRATTGVDDVFLVKAAPVPIGGALKAVSGQKIVMEGSATGLDTITVAASVANANQMWSKFEAILMKFVASTTKITASGTNARQMPGRREGNLGQTQ